MLVNKKDLMTSQTTRTQRDSKLNGRIGWQPVVFSRRDDRSKCFRIRIDTKESYALDENKNLNLWQSELPFPRKTFLYNLKYDGNIVFSGDLIKTLYPNDLKINPRIRLRNKVFIIISFFSSLLRNFYQATPYYIVNAILYEPPDWSKTYRLCIHKTLKFLLQKHRFVIYKLHSCSPNIPRALLRQ